MAKPVFRWKKPFSSDFVEMAFFCVQCDRKIAYFESMPSAHAQTFSLLPVFLPALVEGW